MSAELGRVLLVENGESRIALSTARALHSAGWRVGVGAPVPGPAARSRSVWRRHVIPLPSDGVDAFLDAVGEAARQAGYDLVLGVGDAELFALSVGRDRLAALVPYAPHEAVLATLDKVTMESAACSSGLAVPRRLDPAALGSSPGPFVVKPSAHGAVGHRGVSKIEACRVPDAEQARLQVARIEALGAVAVVQEAVEGSLGALSLVLDRQGGLVAATQQRAERTHPPGVGVSARASTVPVDTQLLERCLTFLRSTGWWGLVELQFLGLGPDAVLIDVNGRVYGSVALAVAAGANLPDLWARTALGLPVPAGVLGRPGVGYQWLEGDLRRAVLQRDGGLLRDVGGTLLAAPGRAHSVLSLRDPVPALWTAAQLAQRGVRKAGRGAG